MSVANLDSKIHSVVRKVKVCSATQVLFQNILYHNNVIDVTIRMTLIKAKQTTDMFPSTTMIWRWSVTTVQSAIIYIRCESTNRHLCMLTSLTRRHPITIATTPATKRL